MLLGLKATTHLLILLSRKAAAQGGHSLADLADLVAVLGTEGLAAPHQQTLPAKGMLVEMALIIIMAVAAAAEQVAQVLTDRQALAQVATENLLL